MLKENSAKLDLNAIKIFQVVAEQGSFTKAADILSITKSTVSRKISDFEQSLGVQLLLRNTRSLELTPEGELCLSGINQALYNFKETLEEVKLGQQAVKGCLRIHVATGTSSPVMMRHISRFCDANPLITVSIETGDAPKDIVAERIDLLLTNEHPTDSNLDAIKFVDAPLMLVCSPAYINKHQPLPEKLSDLSAPFERILCTQPQIQKLSQSINHLPYRVSTNRLDTVIQLCSAGRGITAIPVQPYNGLIESGELIHIYPDQFKETISVYCVYAARTYTPRRQKAFVDYITNAFTAHQIALKNAGKL